MSSSIIFHIDVNSAYLSWEAAYQLQSGNPIDLRDIPSVIGGNEKSRHGIVLAKSIPAKKYNIKTGETLFSARSKCPGLVVVPPRYHLYMQCSKAMIDLLRNYTPTIQRYSIDEVFLDLRGAIQNSTPLELAYEIKERIKMELGFTVNIGISTNKLLAKMASEFEKPDRVHTLFHEEIPSKMWPLHIKELFMVGSSTGKKLQSKGIMTIGDLARCNPKYVEDWLKSHGLLIWNYANGIESSTVRIEDFPMKGLGNSTTLAFDIKDSRTAHMVLLSLIETVSIRLRDAQKCAQVISVSLKNNEFITYSHQRKLEIPTDSTKLFYENAKELFNEMWKDEPLRHLGVHYSKLCTNEFFQLSMFQEQSEKQRKLDRAIDALRFKYGNESLVRSCFLESGLKPLMGGVLEEGDYPMMSSLL